MRTQLFRRHRNQAITIATALTVGALSVPGQSALAAPDTSCALSAGFGRMFPNLAPASFAYDDLNSLAEASIEVSHFQPDPGSGMNDEMKKFPAGYTYTGQFIDHDIVLDPRPNDLLTPVDPATLTNARTPALDLDSVYGAGPSGSPWLFKADGIHLKLGASLSGAASDPAARDLLRDANGQALIGDPRDDENRIVGSLHSLVTRFHNLVADNVRADHPAWTNTEVYNEARQQVIWHYQWAVLTDFLPLVAGKSETGSVVKRDKSGWVTNLKFYNSCVAPMPVEFAAAAYRFGHSIVRNDYTLNDEVHDLPVFTPSFNPTESLVGFQPAPANFATDWNFFFNMDKNVKAQDAYQFDNSLVPALRLIPGPAAGNATTILSTRNLLRGQQVGLPSGQDVARALGLKPLRDEQILVGPTLGPKSPGVQSITDISPAFAGRAPLWTYVLAETAAQNFDLGKNTKLKAPAKNPRLGPVGGRIVTETIVGLMLADPNSILNHAEFRPDSRYASGKDKMLVQDIVRVATGG